MVTFALPGDDVESSSGTPRARPQLGFATRHLNNSPFASNRLGTPQRGSARKLLAPRDELPSASLNKGSIATARNIFRSSDISDSPPRTTPFSPALPQSTMKKAFKPSATPEATHTFRDSSTTAQPAPRGLSAKSSDKELFEMRISEPPEHLTGSVLSKQVPKEWNSKSSIYADQYLAHLCPPGFDDEQRRQFFCILDLRRLKYAADEIFSGKTWKLNVVNFAKEFDKSRSLILLRYGLYEFQNVKPSKEILKKWRRDHGLPDPEDEDEATPLKTKSPKKRRATDDGDSPQVKRRTMDKVEEPVAAPLPLPAPASTPVASKNKRKASVGEDADSQRNKLQKTPSAAKSMFEKIANKASTTPADSPAKPSFFSSAASKPVNGGLARSIFQNKANGGQGASNIFGHLSDTGSAKGSGVDADDESETSSDADVSGEASQSNQQAADGDEDMTSAAKELSKNSTEAGFSSSVAGTRESTPGRSLFDRVTKADDGHAVRAETTGDIAAKPLDQTWNPSTTPIKFGPPTTGTQSTSLFGASTTPAATPSTSLFGAGPVSNATNIFGAPKSDVTVDKSNDDSKKDAESDKENESQPPAKKAAFEPQAPSTQSMFGGSSLFQSKPAATETPKEPESAKTTTNLFGAANTTSSASNIFGAPTKQNETSNTPTPVLSSSTLFGSKPTSTEKPSTPSLFGAKPAESNAVAAEPPKTNLFGGASTSAAGGSASSNLFGANSTGSSSNLFGNSAAKPAGSTFPDATGASKTDTEAPKFSFGGSSEPAQANGITQMSKPMFGAPKSPPASTPGNMFDGSPMKQDEASPAKKPAPTFSFGGTPASAPASNLFGGTSASSAPTGNIFGQNSATNGNAAGSSNIFGGTTAAPDTTTPNSSFVGNPNPGGFNFSFGGPSATSGPGSTPASGAGFTNPFASGNTGSTDNAGGPGFSFGASSTGSADTAPFQFGAAPSTTSGSFQFGANQPSTNGAGSGGPTFSFSGAPSQPSQNSGGTTFGQNTSSNVFNLQPTAGASSGTSKSPFPNRKIRPLKRRT